MATEPLTDSVVHYKRGGISTRISSRSVGSTTHGILRTRCFPFQAVCVVRDVEFAVAEIETKSSWVMKAVL
jgi:hypothetical protein